MPFYLRRSVASEMSPRHGPFSATVGGVALTGGGWGHYGGMSPQNRSGAIQGPLMGNDSCWMSTPWSVVGPAIRSIGSSRSAGGVPD